MKGKILDFSIQDGTGTISDNEETRYGFSVEDWKSSEPPKVGQIVDFELDDNNTKDIYVLQQEPGLFDRFEINGWSWMGFFLAPYYYAGYGELKKAIIMGVLIAIKPILGLVVAIYGGINANKDLPIKKVKFDWNNVGILIFVVFVLRGISSYLMDGSGPSPDSLVESSTEMYKKAPSTITAEVANMKIAMMYIVTLELIDRDKEECLKDVRNKAGAIKLLDKEARKEGEIWFTIAEEFCGNPSGFNTWFKEEVIPEFNDETNQETTIDDFNGIGAYTSRGIDREQAIKWQKKGIETSPHFNTTVPPHEEYGAITAVEWKSVGIIETDMVEKLGEIGIRNPSTYASWKNVGLSTIPEISKWQNIGINKPSVLTSFREIGLSRFEDIASWQNTGFKFDDISSWIKAGINNPEEAIEWNKICKPSEVKKYAAAGIYDYKEAQEWNNVGVNAYNVQRWKTLAKVRTPQDVIRLKNTFQIGKNPNDVRFLYSSSRTNSIEKLFEWGDAGVTNIGMMQLWISDAKIYSPQKILEWRKVGVTTPHKVLNLRRKGINSPEEYTKNKLNF